MDGKNEKRRGDQAIVSIQEDHISDFRRAAGDRSTLNFIPTPETSMSLNLSHTSTSALSPSILGEIDARVASQHLLQHPFYQAWSRGDLSLEALRDYATQYYHHVAAFPTYLSAVHTQTENAEVRRHILSNLVDEEAGSPNHPELWLRFAESLGLDRTEVQRSAQWPATKKLIEDFR